MKKTRLMLALALTLLVVLLGSLIWLLPQALAPAPTVPPTQPTAAPTAPPTEPPTDPPTEPTEPPTDPPIVPESTVTISVTGDMLMHETVINSGKTDSGYDFSYIFRYFASYVQAADLSICNLETTLAGRDNGYKYTGYPRFNCPDQLVYDLKDAGFDTILTANNHSYDTNSFGFRRTPEVIREAGLSVLGTKQSADDPNYLLFDLNGVRVGMACYTYETDETRERKSLNGIPVSQEDIPLLQSFDYEFLDMFYDEVAESIAQMRAQGVDTVIYFIHWGYEYNIRQNSIQSAMAQKLCDLGVDVIVGGHPHVVQPMELLTSTLDTAHTTVCLYSMGNSVSNQRAERMNLKTGHTEDGLLLSLRYVRYSDGTVLLEQVQILPTWVELCIEDNRRYYTILPLDDTLEDWQSAFSLSDSDTKKAHASYERTMDIVGSGLEAVNAYLSEVQAQTEAALGVVR